jgi:hypothetical protein
VNRPGSGSVRMPRVTRRFRSRGVGFQGSLQELACSAGRVTDRGLLVDAEDLGEVERIGAVDEGFFELAVHAEQRTRVHVRVWNGRKVDMSRSSSRARGSRPPVGRDVPPEVPCCAGVAD